MMDRTPLRRAALRTTTRRPLWARALARVRGGSDLWRRLAGVAILAALIVFGLSRLASDPRVPGQMRVAVAPAPPSRPVPPEPDAAPPSSPPPRTVAPTPLAQPVKPSAPPAAPADTRQAALDQILLEDFDWQKDVFGAVASATFRIRNTTGRDARDIAIACVYFTPAGAVAGTRLRQTYEQVRAGQSLVVRDLSMGLIPEGARRVACEVRGAVLE